MKLYLTILLIIGSVLSASAQVFPIIIRTPHKEPQNSDPFTRKIKKHGKYKRNVWRYTYEVGMKDGSVLKANSDILKDSVSGKYFLYYSKADSVKMIYPEETFKLKRPNPFDMTQIVEGLPWDNRWRFTLLKGKINAYCFFIKGKQISQIQMYNGEIIDFNPDYLKSLIENHNKALKAWESKDYYTAIKLYNKKNRDR